MDRAYENDEPRQLAAGPGFTPVVPPKSCRPESCRRIFSRFGKLDDMHPGFSFFVLIFDALRSTNTP